MAMGYIHHSRGVGYCGNLDRRLYLATQVPEKEGSNVRAWQGLAELRCCRRPWQSCRPWGESHERPARHVHVKWRDRLQRKAQEGEEEVECHFSDVRGGFIRYPRLFRHSPQPEKKTSAATHEIHRLPAALSIQLRLHQLYPRQRLAKSTGNFNSAKALSVPLYLTTRPTHWAFFYTGHMQMAPTRYQSTW